MNNTSLENAYSLIICERQLLSELKTIDEGTLQNISDKVYNWGTGVGTDISNKGTEISKWATGVGTDMNKWATEISKWATEDLPSYVQNLTNFLGNVAVEGAIGAVATKIIGIGLINFAKKLNKESLENKEIMQDALTPQIQEGIKAIEKLKKTNPAEYQEKCFQIAKNARAEMEKALKSKGITTKNNSTLVIFMNFVGNLLNNSLIALSGGVVIAYFLQKLGFNPAPIFPAINK